MSGARGDYHQSLWFTYVVQRLPCFLLNFIYLDLFHKVEWLGPISDRLALFELLATKYENELFIEMAN